MKSRQNLLFTLTFATLLGLSVQLKSQSFTVDFGLGTDSNHVLALRNLNGSVGYSFNDKDYLAHGLKLQSYSIVPRWERSSDDQWTTHTLLNLAAYSEGRYHLHLLRINDGTEKERSIGCYPQVRLYFAPYLPRRIKYLGSGDDYSDMLEVRAEYGAQLAFGLGAGIFIEPKYSSYYLAVSIEYSTLDGLRQLRGVNSPWRILASGPAQFTLGISLYFY